MDRIHRLGQHRPVHAIKLVIEDSIESRIIQVSRAIMEFTMIKVSHSIVTREEEGYG